MSSNNDLLMVITNHYGQCDRADGVYSYSFEPYEQGVSRNQPFFLNSHLLERRVIEDVSRAPVVH